MTPLLRASCSSSSRHSTAAAALRQVVALRCFSASPIAQHAAAAATARKALTVGVRAEGKNRWERRVPIMPEHVERLVKESGANVIVQPSTKRVVPDEKYQLAGATISKDLSKADIIVGVKEVPIDQLIADKTYMFFSHTHKGQKYNMPLLQSVLDKRIRLIDYELMTNEHGRRLVQFSRFAGYAGMIDCMHGLGHRLLALGYGNPFLACGMSYMYRTLADARLDVTRTGQVIMDDGLPRSLGPLSFVFTGDGEVARGAMHVFKCLPHEWVTPNELRKLYETDSWDNHKVYGCQVKPSDYLVRKDGWKYDMDDYRKHPDQYMSIFHEKIAPYASVLVNGIFWDSHFPRLLTKAQAHQLAKENRFRMLSIADISCDIGGSLEFMSHSTTIDDPFYMYDAVKQSNHDDMEANGVQIMSIDNLPSELPLEASEYFSNALFPHLNQLVAGNFDHPVLKRATIATHEGKLAPARQRLANALAEHGQGAKVSAHQKVLLLGSGFVSAPLVDYMLRESNRSVTIASNLPAEAAALSRGRAKAPVTGLNVSDKAALAKLVKDHDVVVSFVPATLHPIVADVCIDQKKNMVTASYISPAMQALDEKVKAAGITVLNEVGLDPGIDHLTAMQLFDEVREKGGKITSFVSWCGGLPAPEASNNPLGYKFSWSPKGVLLAGLNSAHFKHNGKIHQVPGNALFESAVPIDINKGFALEGIPNRDSLKYVDLYNLGDISELTSMFRGTLRYRGYCALMASLRNLGLMNDKPRTDIRSGMSWSDLMDSLIGGKGQDKQKAIAARLSLDASNPQQAAHLATVVDALNWLEMFSDETPVASQSESVFDAFCDHLQKRLVYAPGERDMVAMHHEFGIRWRDGSNERRTSTLFAYGEPGGYTAMAKTVGLPAAIGTELLLSGNLKRKGVIAPMTKDVYKPMLAKLEAENIRFVEEIHKIK
ncbi:hypothetical protein HDU89_008226 [Geranomyces variabilis]|nr:hypothetical protein HDU89_008226 [Geranomyces variabilis]